MSVVLDFSFKNPLIRDYFKGKDDYIPVSELMYIHSHPLVTPNFLAEIEVLLNQTSEIALSKRMKDRALQRIIYLTQSLGKLLPLLSESNATEALILLREIYKFCNVVIGK